MPDTTPKINLPYILASQTMKHVSVNEAFNIIDKLINCCAKSRLVTNQPANPNDGDCYIIPNGASGIDWQNYPTGAIAAFYNLGWTYFTPREGYVAWLEDQDMSVVFANNNWVPVSGQLNRSLNYISNSGFIARIDNGNAIERQIDSGVNIKIDNPNGANANPKIALDTNAAMLLNNNFTANQISSKAQAGSINWLGDIDGAKWATKLGGYMLSFASDSNVHTNALGNDNIAMGGRNYAVKVRLNTYGQIETLTGYIVNGTIVANSNGHLQLKTYTIATKPSTSTLGEMIAISDGANNKKLAISDGTNWRYADGVLV